MSEKVAIWFVLISKQGGYIVHSAHTSEAKAREWAACKQHDNEDTAIAEMGKELWEDLLTTHEKGKP